MKVTIKQKYDDVFTETKFMQQYLFFFKTLSNFIQMASNLKWLKSNHY